MLPQECRVELIAGQQEQEPEARVSDQLDAGGVGDAERVRPDDHAADEEQHDLRYPRPGECRADERGERGDDEDGKQALQALGDIHAGLLAEPTESARGAREPPILGH